MKRLCSMLLVLALALSMLPQLDLRVFAAEEDPTATTTAPAPTAEPEVPVAGTSGIYTYEIANGEVTITDCDESASGAIEIPSTINGYPVTVIGESAFNRCHYLTSVIIPDSVTSIGKNAFYDLRGLTSVTIGNGVTTIGESAFYGSNSLSSVTIGNNVTDIGSSAFEWCVSLSSVTIPDSVTTIGDYAFTSCQNLICVVIGDGVTTIGECAFLLCEMLSDITIGNSVTTIGGSAFDSCSMTKITIPVSVTTIDEYVFYDCPKLTDVYYEGTQEQWNQMTIASSNASLLNATIHFAEEDVDITDFLKYKIVDNEVTITGYKEGIPAELNIPATIDGYPVTTIGDFAFVSCDSLTSVTIPDSVNSIEENAFIYTGLTSVNIGNGVNYIGEGAFGGCSKLTTILVGEGNQNFCTDSHGVLFNKGKTVLLCAPVGVSGIYTIPESVTTIHEFAFYFCTGLTGVTIPDGVTVISSNVFYNCPKLCTVSMGKNITVIEDAAFEHCYRLTLITLPESVTTIGDWAFYGCGLEDVNYTGSESQWNAISISANNSPLLNATIHFSASLPELIYTYEITEDGTVTIVSLRLSYYADLTIPETIDGYPVTTIADRAFENCHFLTRVAFPGSLQYIGDYAFADCTYLTTITISDSVTTIGEGAFKRCTALTDLSIGNGVTTIGVAAFSYCYALTNVTIPDSVTTIGSSAFAGCVGLTAVTIGDGVTTIGVAAFEGCTTLTDLSIGSGVTTIGNSAFSFCTALPCVTIPDTVIVIDHFAFRCCYALVSITIPYSVKTIGNYVFDFCTALTEIRVDEDNTEYSSDVYGVLFNKDKTQLIRAPGTIQTYAIPDGVTYIDPYAFGECTSLTSVVVPGSVTTISDYVFYECTSLIEIRVDEDNTEYSSDVYGVLFNKDKTQLIRAPGAIQTYVIPTSVTTIGDAAFDGCINLTSVTIPDSVTTIGYSAFFGCTGLTSVTIPDSVNTIDRYAFERCLNLTEITLGSGVTAICYGALKNCFSLADVYYEGPQKDWEQIRIEGENSPLLNATIHFSGLHDHVFSDYVSNEDATCTNDGTKTAKCVHCDVTDTQLDPGTQLEHSFTHYAPDNNATCTADGTKTAKCDNCEATDTLTDPGTQLEHTFTTYIYNEDATCTEDGTKTAKCDGCELTDTQPAVGTAGHKFTNYIYNEDATCAEDGTETAKCDRCEETYTRTAWGTAAHTWDDGVYTDPTTEANGYTTYVCTVCDESMTVEDEFTKLPDGSFTYEETESGEVTITSFGEDITGELIIPKSIDGKPVTTIADGAFKNCVGLTKVAIPGSVTTIGEKAFVGCSNLEVVYVGTEQPKRNGNGGLVIGDYAFDGCTNLQEVYLAADVTAIGNYAFRSCTSLTTINIPDGVTSIGDYAFRNCTSLTSITIPNSVATIGDGAFYGCSAATSVSIGTGVVTIGNYAFYGCTGLGSISFCAAAMNDLTENSCIFDNAGTGLISVYIGSAVTRVPAYLFYIKNVALNIAVTFESNSVCQSIGSYAFAKCTIRKLTIPDSVKTIGDHAFYNCSSLSGITLGSGLTTIGAYAFSGCTGLTAVTIPDSVTTIGNSAFYGCTGMTTLTIGSGLKTISEAAFQNCTGLLSVTIPDNIEVIDKSAFAECTALSVVNIGSGVVTIGQSAFRKCTGLATVTIPDNVQTVGRGAFIDCSGMTKLNIGSGVATIEAYAFSGCINLSDVTIPGNVVTVGEYAFSGCEALNRVTLTNGIDTIGDYAFCGCTNLTNVFIPESVSSIGIAPFYGCTGLSAIEVDENSENYCNDAYGVLFNKSMRSLIQAPGTIETYANPDTVVTVCKHAFAECAALTAVTIPDSVTTIGYGAFYNCSDLTELAIGNAVVTIDDYAFYRCSGLTAVTILDSVKTIGGYAFYECTGLTELTIGTSVTAIGEYAFAYCSGLTAVTIPNKVKTIGTNAFCECAGLTALTIGTGVTEIGDYAFYRCTGLTTVAVPDSVKTIGEYAFSGCTGVTGLTLGSGLNVIGNSAFSSCTGLTSLVIPENVTTIGRYAFAYCSGITGLTIGLRVTTIGESAFRGCTGLTAVVIPNRVTAISNSTFFGCTGLTSVTIGTRVTSIGISAFEGCTGLTAVVIPNNVKTIGSNAFARCTGLTDITIGTGVTSIGDAAFSGCTGLTVFTIPENVTTVGNRLVDGCTGLEKVLYKGTREKWGGLTVGSDNATLRSLLECKYDIDEHPKTTTVVSGDTVTFRVEVPGNVVAVKSYKWQYRKIYKWFDTTMTGYNTDTLTVPASGSRHGYDYRCMITFTNGKVVYSDPAEMTVITTINITSHPNDQTAVLGYKGQFTAAAEGESIKYQWQYKRPGGSSWMDTAMEGATKPTVYIETTVARNGYQYRCKITDVTGKVAYTNPATMRVLSLTAQPKDKTVLSGASVQFSVSTSVTDGFTYQWQYSKDGTSWTNTTMAGYNTSTLTVEATVARNGYQYRCVLTGAKKSTLTSKAATLTVGKAVAISQQPVDQLAADGTQAKFTVAAENVQSYQWQYSKNGSSWSNTAMTGCKTDTLTVDVIEDRDGYRYRCAMTALDGTVFYSASATLLVGVPAAITSQPANAEAFTGVNVSFTVETEGAVSYLWYYKQSADADWKTTNMTGYDTATLTVEATEARNGYRFRCVVTGKDGESVTSNSAGLMVIYIETQPAKQRTAENTDAKFTVHVANATAATTYQWLYHTGVDGTWTEAGSGSNVLTVPATAAMNGYQYKCIITDSCGNTIETETVRLYVVRITDQPDNKEVYAGNNAVFSIALSDATDATYQWQYSRDNGVSWSDTTATGYNTDTLTVEATTARNGYLYRCVVTMPNGSKLTSDTAALTAVVLPSATITSQPSSATVVTGTTVNFQVKADNATAYCWYYQQSSDAGWTITNMTTDTLTVSATAARSGYKFRCVITGMDGETVTTNEVMLKVISIYTQPVSQKVILGANPKFVVSLDNATDTTKYQWMYRTSSTGSWTNCTATGADSSVMTVTAAADNNGYQYKCVFTDNYGNSIASDVVTLTVVWITGQPVNKTVYVGENAVFGVSVSDSADVTYEWQYSRDNGTTWTTTTATGYNTDTLTVEATTARSGYQYRCIITLPNGSKLTSDVVTLTAMPVLMAAEITSQPTDTTVVENADAKFKVTANNATAYSWYYRSADSTSWTVVSFADTTTNTLTVKATTARDGYKFRCVVTGEDGETVISDTVTLTVTHIAAQPTAQKVFAGDNAVFTVKLNNAAADTKYEWMYRVGADADWTNTTMTGYNTNTLTVAATNARNGYQYKCVITDGSRNTIETDAAVLTVVSISVQPVNTQASLNTNAVFSLTLSDAANVTYQWQYSKSGTAWTNTGSNSNSLTVTATEEVNGYLYRCVMTLPNGSTLTSDAVTLSLPAAVITSQPSNATVVEGTDVVFAVEAQNATSYQWYCQQSADASWKVTNFTGNKTNTLTVPATAARHGYKFRCVVYGEDGEFVRSDEVSLKVIYIYTQPVSQRVIKGANAKFTVSLNNATDTTKYQWKYSKDGTSWINTTLTGYNTAALTVEATTSRNGYQYKCVITDNYGNTMETDVVDLSVVYITAQPTGQTVTVGETATFSLTLSDATDVTYEWEYSRDSGTSWTATTATGYNTNTLKVEATTARNGYQYRCVITLPNGTKITSNAVTLTANAAAQAAVITEQPGNMIVVLNANAEFKVSATGAVSYRWYCQQSADADWKTTSFSGYNTATLTVPATVARSGYKFRCVVTGEDGETVTTKEVFLKVISISSQPTAQTVATGSNAKFAVETLNATSNTTYQWMYRTSSTGSWMSTTMTGYNTKTLTVAAINARNGYQYKCMISDNYGNTLQTSIVKLNVVYINNQTDNVTASAGTNAVFTFGLSYTTGVTYQWQYSKNGTTWSNTTMTGYNTKTLTVQATTARNGYMYRCIITLANGDKLTTREVTLTVN